MEDYYAAMVPQLGLPLQVIIIAAKKRFLEVYTLSLSPEVVQTEPYFSATGFNLIIPIQSNNRIIG